MIRTEFIDEIELSFAFADKDKGDIAICVFKDGSRNICGTTEIEKRMLDENVLVVFPLNELLQFHTKLVRVNNNLRIKNKLSK